MIRTANVASAGRQAVSRMSGEPTGAPRRSAATSPPTSDRERGRQARPSRGRAAARRGARAFVSSAGSSASAAGVGADRHEGHVAEREDARSCRRTRRARRRTRAASGRARVVRSSDAEPRPPSTVATRRREQDQPTRRASDALQRASHPRLALRADDQALRPHEQDDDHERVARTRRGRSAARAAACTCSATVSDAEHEAADDRADEAAHAAEDRRDEARTAPGQAHRRATRSPSAPRAGATPTPASRPLIANADGDHAVRRARRAAAPCGSPRPPRASARRAACAPGTATRPTSSTDGHRRRSITVELRDRRARRPRPTR